MANCLIFLLGARASGPAGEAKNEREARAPKEFCLKINSGVFRQSLRLAERLSFAYFYFTCLKANNVVHSLSI